MITKQNINLPIAVSIDTKTDPFQLSLSNIESMVNGVFTKDKRLGKRNGYALLASLPTDSMASTLNTFKGNLTAIGNTLSSYSEAAGELVNKGYFQPVQLDVVPLVRSSYNQSSQDAAVAPNGLVCATFLDGDGNTKYQISDSVTGQSIVAPVTLPNSGVAAKVFVLGNYFIVTFLRSVSGTARLSYIAIPQNNLLSPTAPANLSSAVSSATTAAYDGYVSNNQLFIAWNASDGGGAIRATTLDLNLNQGSTSATTSVTADRLSLTVDSSGSTDVIWISYYTSSGTTLHVLALNQILVQILAPTLLDTKVVNQLTNTAINGVCTTLYQVTNSYSFDSGVRTDIIESNTMTIAGVAGTAGIVVRGQGLASRAFLVNSVIFFLATYSSDYQPTYFLINGSGKVVAKLAYSNGGGYITTKVLPNVTVSGSTVAISYLYKDLITSVNKQQGAPSVNGIYSQTGVNLATFDLAFRNLVTAEIGNNLHIAGGFLWAYDGINTVEHNYHLWPDLVEVGTATTGGNLTAQQYFYQVVYEWTDAQGNIHRSAPSIPITVTTTGTTSANTINISTLRITYKSLVRIVIYRWSTAQQNYYQVTSVSSATLNSTASDAVAYVDTQADSSIIGNQLIYTTGGVVENIAAPACSTISLFGTRLVLVDSEDKSLVWYSKPVIEATPVEMSDLFTVYVNPTTTGQGPVTCLEQMDDKLILFKENSPSYITGQGPDITGANNDFSEPVFINAPIGCTNQQSIVLTPEGLQFQSNKGIWLLQRSLGSRYIGDRVEGFNDATVVAASLIPDTNQVRMLLDTGTALMYDYYYDRWGTFSNVPAISNTIYNGLHTYLTSTGEVRQETPDLYTDVNHPVLMSITTGWVNLQGLQGYQRFYQLYLLATYLSPHTLSVGIAYDYNKSLQQNSVIHPNNFSGVYGSVDPSTGVPYYGTGQAFGGPGNKEQWRVFPFKQKCESFQVTIQENFDGSFGTVPGAGLTLSGINIVVGLKKGYRPIPASQSVG